MRKAAWLSWANAAVGFVVVIALWWLLAVTAFAPTPGSTFTSVPTPWQVLTTIASDGPGFYWRYFQVTLTEAGIGYVWGNLLALVLASIVLVLPRLEPVLMQIAVISYCVPIVAVGALAIIIVGGAKTPGNPSATAIFLAALSVFFTTVVGALVGLKAADARTLDVVTVFGGGRFTQLRKVRLLAALPGIMNALQIAVPAAFLGAVLGEYFGKIEVSVGTLMVSTQVQLDSAHLWALFILSAVVALAGYALVGALGRWLTPWAPRRAGAR